MQIILLSGGSGKRLWPLSGGVNSKQFLRLFTDSKGNSESILQRVYAQIKEALPQAEVTIAANAEQRDIIREQLGESVDIVAEPQRRDTYPAIALACAYLASQKKVDPQEPVFVLPSDPYTETGFFQNLVKLRTVVSEDRADIALIGIKPLSPSSGYGYIMPQAQISDHAFSVQRFVEKPDEDTAANLIRQGAYWNGGVFAFKLRYLTDIIKEDTGYECFDDITRNFNTLDKISFDYKIVEKAKRVGVVPYSGKWMDVGTWGAITGEMTVNTSGKVVAEKAENTYVINDLDIPVLALGTKNLVIIASPNGILVADREESAGLKPVVERIESI